MYVWYGKAYRISMVKIPVAFPRNPVNVCVKNVTVPLAVRISSAIYAYGLIYKRNTMCLRRRQVECKGRVYLPPASGSCYSYQERKVDGAVWTERGWTSSDCEKESTASRQKLLSRHYCSRYSSGFQGAAAPVTEAACFKIILLHVHCT